MKIKLLGIDLAKNVFQICALNQANKVLFNRSIRRARFCSSIGTVVFRDTIKRGLFSIQIYVVKTLRIC